MLTIQNCTYIALKLSERSRRQLMTIAMMYADRYRFSTPMYYAHHMTIAYKPVPGSKEYNWCQNNKGLRYNDIVIRKIGVSDKAIAVLVETACPSANKIKHITLAVDKDKYGRPVDSNKIERWEEFEFSGYRLTGEVEYFK